MWIHEPPKELSAAVERLLMLIWHSSTTVDVFHKRVNVDVCHASVMFKCNSTPRSLLICHSSMTVDVYHTSVMHVLTLGKLLLICHCSMNVDICHAIVMLVCHSMQIAVNLS